MTWAFFSRLASIHEEHRAPDGGAAWTGEKDDRGRNRDQAVGCRSARSKRNASAVVLAPVRTMTPNS